MASVAVGIVGAGIGSALGNPMLGWSIGTVVGGVLFPARQPGQSINHVRLNKSDFGASIPRVWGQMRLGGNVIWTTDLVKNTHSSSSISGPSSSTWYSVSCAVMICAGPVNSIVRMYANSKIVYDSTRSSMPSWLTFYPGSETQTVDPIIAANTPTGQCPAHRGYCYVVIDNFDLSKFGNQMPTWSFEINQGTPSVGSIVSDVCVSAGLSTSQIDVSQMTSLSEYPVTGFMLHDKDTGTNGLSYLFQAYPGDLVEVDGLLRLVARGGASIATIAADEIGSAAGQKKGAQGARVSTTRTADVEVPAEVDVLYYDQARLYQQGTQRAMRMAIPSIQDLMSVTIPAVLSDTQARQTAERLLYTGFLEREQYQIALGPKYLYLSPADIIEVPLPNSNSQTARIRIDRIEPALFGEVTITGVLDDPAPLSQVVTGDGSTSTTVTSSAVVPTSFLAFSQEILPTDGFYTGFYVAAGPTSNAAYWPGCMVWYSADSGTSWISGGLINSPGVVGTTTSVLASYTGTNPDTVDTFNVDLVTGTLGPATQAEVNSGINVAIVGAEVLGFTGASLISANNYTLSNLTRALDSTVTTGHVSGEQFALVTTASRIAVSDSLAGTSIMVQCTSPDVQPTSTGAQTITIATKSGGPGNSASSSPTVNIAAAGAIGTSTSYARADHTHQGVHSFNTLVGDVSIAAGTNITLSTAGNVVTVAASAGGGSDTFTVTYTVLNTKYVIGSTEQVIIVDASNTSSQSVELPASSGNTGRAITIKNASGYSVTVSINSSTTDKIENTLASFTLSSLGANPNVETFVSDGAGSWWIV